MLTDFTKFLTVVFIGVCFHNMFKLQQDVLYGNIQVIPFVKTLPIFVVAFLLIKYIQLILLSGLYKFRRMRVLPYPRFWIQILSLILLYVAFFYAFIPNTYVYALFGAYGLNAGFWMYVFFKEGYANEIINKSDYKIRYLLFIRAVINFFMGSYFLILVFLTVLFAEYQSPDTYLFGAREIYYYYFLICYCAFNIFVDISFIGFLFTSRKDYNQSLTVRINRGSSH